MNSSIIGTNVRAGTGLYDEGELAECSHGNNRLDGYTLLDEVLLVASLANMRRRPTRR